MKRRVLLNVLLCLALAAPAWAESRSHTVQVSCTVPLIIEMAGTEVRSTLDKQYQMTEDVRIRDGERVRLYSLTAL